MAKRSTRKSKTNYSPDGERRADDSTYLTRKYKKEKQKKADSVYKDRDLGGGIGDRQYYWRNPGGAGRLGISPSALRMTAENKETNANYKAAQRKKRRLPILDNGQKGRR